MQVPYKTVDSGGQKIGAMLHVDRALIIGQSLLVNNNLELANNNLEIIDNDP